MITIETLVTSFRLLSSRGGYAIDDSGNTTSVNLLSFVNKYLRQVELPTSPYGKQIVTYYCYYDKDSSYCYFPYSYLDNIRIYLTKLNKQFRLKSIEPHRTDKIINISFDSKFKDKDGQTEIIDFMVDDTTPMKLIELQTGFGKTYCAIKAISILKKRTLIIVPGHLQDQWISEILKFTSMTENDIYVIKGKKSILELLPNRYKGNHSIFVSTIDTLYQYISRFQPVETIYPPMEKIAKNLDIEVKIIDEIHLKFRQLLVIDMVLNIRKNIYLSATFMRTNSTSNRIFQKYFSDEFKFKSDNYSKYVNITEYKYGVGFIPEPTIRTPKGYSEIKYEKLLLKMDFKFKFLIDEVLVPILYRHYLNIKKEGEKCLILIKLKKFGRALRDAFIKKGIEKEYGVKIGVYFSEHTKEERDKLDIIISTIQSSGVGADIPKLRTEILFDNFSAEHWLLQCVGRLRELKETTPEFVYLTNKYVKSHLNYSYKKGKIFRDCTKNFKSIEI